MPFAENDGSVFLFDLEWVENTERTSKLLPFYRKDRSQTVVLPMDVGGMGVEEFKRLIKSMSPPVEWLYQAEACEMDAKKPRSGVLEAIKSELDAINAPLPSKVTNTAEAVDIVCLSYALPHDNYEGIQQVTGFKECVETFWDLCREHRPCGYAIEFADLPVMLSATIQHGIATTRTFNLSRGFGYIDIMKARYGRNEPCKQRDVAMLMGYSPSEVDPLKDGSEVAEAFHSGRMSDILTHNYLDVECLTFLHRKWNGIFYSTEQ